MTTSLQSTAESLKKLLTDTITALSTPNPPSTSPQDSVPILHDAARLLRAHTTKISLLLLNSPFTPSAINRELLAVRDTVIPGLASACTSATPTTLGFVMATEVKARGRRCLLEFNGLIEDVLSKCAAESGCSAKQDKNKDTLASTGAVWAAADSASALDSLGVPGLLAEKAKEYRDTLSDALDELKGWRDDADDEGFDDSEAVASDGEVEDELDTLDKMLSSGPLPAERVDIRALLDGTLKLLGLLRTLYTAVVKHRFKTLVTPLRTEGNIQRCDEIMGGLRRMPYMVDEVAEGLYELDAGKARGRLEDVRRVCRDVVEAAQSRWRENGPEDVELEDAFEAWCGKFLVAVDGVDVGGRRERGG